MKRLAALALALGLLAPTMLVGCGEEAAKDAKAAAGDAKASAGEAKAAAGEAKAAAGEAEKAAEAPK